MSEDANAYARAYRAARKARIAVRVNTPRTRTFDVPRRCPRCGAAVMLTPRDFYYDERTNDPHACGRRRR